MAQTCVHIRSRTGIRGLQEVRSIQPGTVRMHRVHLFLTPWATGNNDFSWGRCLHPHHTSGLDKETRPRIQECAFRLSPQGRLDHQICPLVTVVQSKVLTSLVAPAALSFQERQGAGTRGRDHWCWLYSRQVAFCTYPGDFSPNLSPSFMTLMSPMRRREEILALEQY